MKRLLLIALLFPALALADTNVTCLRNTNCTIQFELRDAEGATPGLNLEASAVCATGDVTVIKDGAASANATNCFVDETGGSYSMILAAAQIDGKVSSYRIVDQTGTKVWVDKVINVYTYGDSSAFHAPQAVTVGTNNDKTGYELADNAITAAKIATDALGSDEIAASAVTEIQSGLATAAALATVDGNVDDIEIIANKLDGLIEDSSGNRFTEKALEQAPSGGGGSFSCESFFECLWPTNPDIGTVGEGFKIAPRRY